MWKRLQETKDYNDKVEYKRAQKAAARREYSKAKRDFEKKLVKGIKANPKSFYAFVGKDEN